MAERTKRELVMLAEVYRPKKDRTAGMFLSEKLDGMRCLWIPASRGLSVKDIPFANRAKDKRDHKATGLWSRYGKVIHCPDAFVQGFPDYPLDGELYAGRGNFQSLMSAVKKLEPINAEWANVSFVVFDAPKYSVLFQDGPINNPQYSKRIKLAECCEALGITVDHPAYGNPMIFEFTYNTLKKNLVGTKTLDLHKQEQLPFSTPLAIEILEKRVGEIADLGGEGLILRHPASMWQPIRTGMTLKVKPFNDAEARVIGYRTGVGKYLGMLGSLTVQWTHGTFELSGFTDEERELSWEWKAWATANPGVLTEEAALMSFSHISVCPAFKLGDLLTFRYRELTDDNKPKEARYLRPRID